MKHVTFRGKLKGALLPLLLITSFAAQAQTTQAWMSPEVSVAWRNGYTGQGTLITTVEDTTGSTTPFWGNLGNGSQYQFHSDWTSQQSAMVAPSAAKAMAHWYGNAPLPLATGKLNVINNSWGSYMDAGKSVSLDALATSLVTYSRTGQAVVVKSAGNSSAPVGSARYDASWGKSVYDQLAFALIGGQTTIFVGALERNGTTAKKARLASYSSYAGSDPVVQKNFLVVGVDESRLGGLWGTSFGAPIVSGYAAIVGSKFTTATPTQVVNQLLSTARTDTINKYSPSIHGRGEASLTRALAPVSLR